MFVALYSATYGMLICLFSCHQIFGLLNWLSFVSNIFGLPMMGLAFLSGDSWVSVWLKLFDTHTLCYAATDLGKVQNSPGSRLDGDKMSIFSKSSWLICGFFGPHWLYTVIS